MLLEPSLFLPLHPQKKQTGRPRVGAPGHPVSVATPAQRHAEAARELAHQPAGSLSLLDVRGTITELVGFRDQRLLNLQICLRVGLQA